VGFNHVVVAVTMMRSELVGVVQKAFGGRRWWERKGWSVRLETHLIDCSASEAHSYFNDTRGQYRFRVAEDVLISMQILVEGFAQRER
jgi:hypothetical protein